MSRQFLRIVAEGVGFEPTVSFTPRSISSRVPSTGLSHPSFWVGTDKLTLRFVKDFLIAPGTAIHPGRRTGPAASCWLHKAITRRRDLEASGRRVACVAVLCSFHK